MQFTLLMKYYKENRMQTFQFNQFIHDYINNNVPTLEKNERKIVKILLNTKTN